MDSCLELTFLVHVRHKLNKLRQRFAGHFEDRKRHQHGHSLFRMFHEYLISQDATIRADFSPPWSLFNPIPVRLFFTTPSPLQFQQSLWPAPPQFTHGIRQTPSHLSHPIIFDVPGNSIRFRIGFGGKGGGGFAGTSQMHGFSSSTSKSGFSKSFIALCRV